MEPKLLVDTLAYADNEVAKESFNDILADHDSLPLKFSNELRFSKPMLRCWMLEKSSIEPAAKCMACDFLKKKLASGNKHTRHFSYRILPIWNVVNDGKVEYGIKRSTSFVDSNGVTHVKLQTMRRKARKSTFCLFDHVWIDIESVNFSRAKPFEYNLSSNAASAADL